MFYGLVLLFIAAGVVVVLYSEGWRLDTENCSLTNIFLCNISLEKTGAVFIQTKPSGVTIKLDGKIFSDKSSLLQSGTLISNLTPKTYHLEVQKDGYLTWKKDLKVRPQLVSEANDIILVPQNITKESVTARKLRGQKLEGMSNSGDKLIVKDVNSGTYYLYDLNNPTVAFNINVNFDNTAGNDEVVKKTRNHPFDSNKLIVETDGGLYVLDTLRLTFETVLSTIPTIWSTQGSNIYYIQRTRNPDSGLMRYAIYSWNLVIKNNNLVSDLPDNFAVGIDLNQIRVAPAEDRIAILDKSGNLYIFDRTDQSLKQISSDVTYFDFSPDSRKIAFTNTGGKLNILFLGDWNNDNPKKAGDLVQFSLTSQPTKIEWYKDSYHILIGYADELDVTEIDDRPPLNDYPLVQGVADNFHYNESSDYIYFLKNKNLYRLSI